MTTHALINQDDGAESADIHPPPDWTSTEVALWHAYRAGRELNLSDPDPTRNDPADGADWSNGRTLRASAIAQLLLNPPQLSPGQTPRLRLGSARITEILDLGCGAVIPFLFTRCRFDNAPNLNDATTEFVGFVDCYLPGLNASRLQNNGPIWMQGCQSNRPICFDDAHIRGDVDFNRAQLASDAGPPVLRLNGASIYGDFLLRGISINGSMSMNVATIGGNMSITGANINSSRTSKTAISARQATIAGMLYASDQFKCTGEMLLEGVHISGKLILTGATISNGADVALDLDHARIDLGLSAANLTADGTVLMHHANIGCQATFAGAKLSKPDGTAIRADHLIVDGSLLLTKHAIVNGEIDLHGAEIKCTLNLTDSEVFSASEPTIEADGIRVGRSIIARRASITGGFIMSDAEIGGSVNFSGAKLNRDHGFAFSANRARIAGVLAFDDKFSSVGTISAADAVVTTSLSFVDAEFRTTDNGKCFSAPGLHIDGDIIGDRVHVEGLVDLANIRSNGNIRLADARLDGVPPHSASLGSPADRQRGGEWRGISLRMTGASVSGELDLRGSTLGHSLVLIDATIKRSILLTKTSLNGEEKGALLAAGLTTDTFAFQLKSQASGTVDLTSASVSTLADGETSWPASAPLKINGFKYMRIESSVSYADRLKWLDQATKNYAPQPYEQLAAYYMTTGASEEARKVNLASIRRSYKSHRLPWRIWGNLQDWLLGYGYKPFRAVQVFAILWVAASLWFSLGVGSCSRFGVHWHNLCPISATDHLSWNPWLYSFDLLVPLINLGYKNTWNSTGISQVISFILIAIGWILTTTIIAAVGRSLRRS